MSDIIQPRDNTVPLTVTYTSNMVQSAPLSFHIQAIQIRQAQPHSTHSHASYIPCPQAKSTSHRYSSAAHHCAVCLGRWGLFHWAPSGRFILARYPPISASRGVPFTHHSLGGSFGAMLPLLGKRRSSSLLLLGSGLCCLRCSEARSTWHHQIPVPPLPPGTALCPLLSGLCLPHTCIPYFCLCGLLALVCAVQLR